MTLAIVPVSGSITAKDTFCRIEVTGEDLNDTTAFDPDVYPTEPAFVYRLDFELGGDVLGSSYLFSGESHDFNNYVFPAAGSWTIHLVDTADESDVETLGVTVN